MSAAYVTPADVVALAPELAAFVLDGEGEPTVPFVEVVDLAADLLDVGVWGERLSRAHWTLSAHFSALQFDPSSAQGAVTSRRVAQISETYATNSAVGEADLSLTKYGRLHLELRKRLSGVSYAGDAARGWGSTDGGVL